MCSCLFLSSMGKCTFALDLFGNLSSKLSHLPFLCYHAVALSLTRIPYWMFNGKFKDSEGLEKSCCRAEMFSTGKLLLNNC